VQPGIAGVVGKFDLDMLFSPSHFEEQAWHDNIRNLHDFLHGCLIQRGFPLRPAKT
jgi:hypothetical protein